MPEPSCPDHSTLADLVLGRLPEDASEPLDAHLAECSRCAASLETISAADDLTASLRTSADERMGLPDDVAALIPALQQLDVRFTDNESGEHGIDVRTLLSPAESDDELGRFGGYRVLEFLGQGGMGIVFRADDERLRRIVAIKIMNPVLAASPVASRRFEREARATAAFEHDHIVTIYHVGEERGLPFFSMQLLEGESLHDRLRRENILPVSELLRIGREVAVGLAAAHARGLLHRDIKPDNIWLQSGEDRVCIVDFGLAQLGGDESRLTGMGTVIGTPDYMAPEQARGDNVDERCDLFSLGSVLYRCATGRVPFGRPTAVATLVAVSEQTPTDPVSLNPQLPAPVSDVIQKLMRKNSDERFQTANEVVEAIRELEASPARLEACPARSRPRRWLTTAIAMAGLAASIVLGVLIEKSTEHGTLIVETFDDDIAVTIEQENILVRDTETGHELELSVGENRVKPGEYEIVARDIQSALTFSATEFAVLDGRTKRIQAHWKPAEDSRSVATVDTVDNEGDTAVVTGTPDWLLPESPGPTIAPGDPIGSTALVRQPQSLDGVLSWTHETTDHRGAVYDTVISPDGKQIATAGTDETIRIWNTGSGELHRILFGHHTPVYALAWSPDGRMLASAGIGDESDIRIWETERFRLLFRVGLDVSVAAGREIAWSPDSRTLAFRRRGIQFLDLDTKTIRPNFGIAGSFSRRPWSPDGRYFCVWGATDLKIWDIRKQMIAHSMSGPYGLSSIGWSATGDHLAVVRTEKSHKSEIQSLEIWAIDSFQPLKTFTIDAASSVSWAPTGESLLTHRTTASGITSEVTNLANDTQITMPFPEDSRHHARSVYGSGNWSGDGRFCVYTVRGRAYRLDLSDRQWISVAGFGDSVVTCPQWWQGSQLRMTSFGSESPNISTACWDLAKLQNCSMSAKPLSRSVSQSPDGQLLALVRQPDALVTEKSGKLRELQILDASTNDVLHTVSFEPQFGMSMRWSPDSRLIAVLEYNRGKISFVDPARGEIVHELIPDRDIRKQFDRWARSDYQMLPFEWAPAGDQFLWAGQQSVQIVDSHTFQVVHHLTMDEPADETNSTSATGGLLGLLGARSKSRAASTSWPGITVACDWPGNNSRIALINFHYSRRANDGRSHQLRVWKRDDVSGTWQVSFERAVGKLNQPPTLSFSPDSQYVCWIDQAEKQTAISRAQKVDADRDRWRLRTIDAENLPMGMFENAAVPWTLGWSSSNVLAVALKYSSSPGVSAYGYWNVVTGEASLNSEAVNSAILTNAGLAVTPMFRNQLEFIGPDLQRQGTLVFTQADGSEELVAIDSSGNHRTSLGAENSLVTVVLQPDGEQILMPVDEFARKYGWTNHPEMALPASLVEKRSPAE